MEYSRITLVLLPALLTACAAYPVGSNAELDAVDAASVSFVESDDAVQRRAKAQYLKKREYELQRSANTGGHVSLEGEEEDDLRARARRAAQYFAVEGSDERVAAAMEAMAAETAVASAKAAKEAMRQDVMRSFAHNVNRAFAGQRQQQQQAGALPTPNRHSAGAAAAAAFAGPQEEDRVQRLVWKVVT